MRGLDSAHASQAPTTKTAPWFNVERLMPWGACVNSSFDVSTSRLMRVAEARVEPESDVALL